jgi:hypothetical protein
MKLDRVKFVLGSAQLMVAGLVPAVAQVWGPNPAIFVADVALGLAGVVHLYDSMTSSG